MSFAIVTQSKIPVPFFCDSHERSLSKMSVAKRYHRDVPAARRVYTAGPRCCVNYFQSVLLQRIPALMSANTVVTCPEQCSVVELVESPYQASKPPENSRSRVHREKTLLGEGFDRYCETYPLATE